MFSYDVRRIFHLTGLLAVCTCPVWAGEYAVLANGFRLHADRHETVGSTVRLFSGDGLTEMPAAAIASFETEENVPQPAAVAPKPGSLDKVTSATPPVNLTPRELALEAAKKFSLPAGIVAGVMKAESGFQPTALSPKGAIGLMQLMPQTARELGVDPKDPQQNATGGAQYLHDLLVKYENHPDQVLLALAAYNAGPAAVEKYHGVPPYRETREYILRVLKNWKQHESGDPSVALR